MKTALGFLVAALLLLALLCALEGPSTERINPEDGSSTGSQD